MNSKSLIIACLAPFISFSAYAKSLQIPRSDGSMISGYMQEAQRDSYPVVIVIPGSKCESIRSFHDRIASHLGPYLNAVVITLEKRGLPAEGSPKGSCARENSVVARTNDYLKVMEYIRTQLPGWDKRVALAAFGEGGAVAAQLGSFVSETVATALFNASDAILPVDKIHLYVAQGGHDFEKPVRDTEEFVAQYRAAGHTSLTYARYDLLDGNWADVAGNNHLTQVVLKSVGWLKDVLNLGHFVQDSGV